MLSAKQGAMSWAVSHDAHRGHTCNANIQGTESQDSDGCRMQLSALQLLRLTLSALFLCLFLLLSASDTLLQQGRQ